MFLLSPWKVTRGKRTDCVAWVVTFLLDARYGGTYSVGVPGDADAERILDAELAALAKDIGREDLLIATAEGAMNP